MDVLVLKAVLFGGAWYLGGLKVAACFSLSLFVCHTGVWNGFLVFDLEPLMLTNDMKFLYKKLSPWPSPISFTLYGKRNRAQPILPFLPASLFGQEADNWAAVRRTKQQLELMSEAMQIFCAQRKIPLPAYALLDMSRELLNAFSSATNVPTFSLENRGIFKVGDNLVSHGLALEGRLLQFGAIFIFVVGVALFVCAPRTILLVFFSVLLMNSAYFYWVLFDGTMCFERLAELVLAAIPITLFWIWSDRALAWLFILAFVMFASLQLQSLDGYDYTGKDMRDIWSGEEGAVFRRIAEYRKHVQLRLFEFHEESEHWDMTWHSDLRSDHVVNYPRLASKRDNGGSVFIIQHGVFDECRSWIPLADWLIQTGHAREVWLLNTKDNVYASEPSTAFNERSSLWQLSDLANETRHFVSKIQQLAGAKKVTYIGHSQGTAQLLALLSFEPSFGSVFEKVILLAPVTIPDIAEADYFVQVLVCRAVKIMRWSFLQETRGLVLPPRDSKILRDAAFMASFGSWLHFAAKTNGLIQILRWVMHGATKAFSLQLFDVAGFLLARPRGGIALSMILNWAKIIEEQKFCDEYREFHIEQITIPIHLVVAKHDWLSNKKHLEKLPNRTFHNLTADGSDSGHMDFALPHMMSHVRARLDIILKPVLTE